MVNPTTFYRQPLLTSSTESELDNCDEGNDDGDDCDGEGEIIDDILDDSVEMWFTLHSVSSSVCKTKMVTL